MTGFISGVVIGLIVGWIALKRPQWVEAATAWVKKKIGLGN